MQLAVSLPSRARVLAALAVAAACAALAAPSFAQALLKDVNTGPPRPGEGSYPLGFVRIGPRVLFQATFADAGAELVATDGTTAGTTLVRDIGEGKEAGSPGQLVSIGNVVLFTAEWGDLSQLLTISLVAKYHEPASVFLGAWLALVAVSGLAVLAGRFLLRHLKLSTVHYAGAAVCLILEAVTLYEILA